MNFGARNTDILRDIALHMAHGIDFTANSRTSYDVSFSFNAQARQASYAEEFRNCGNGHYYLALDSTHALFYEDD